MPQVFTAAGFFGEGRWKCNHCALCIFNTSLIQVNRLNLKENIANINIDSILIYKYKRSDLIQNLNLLFPVLCASRMLVVFCVFVFWVFFLPFTTRSLCFKNAKPPVTYWEISCTHELIFEFKLHVTVNYSMKKYHNKMPKIQWALPVILRNPVYFRNILVCEENQSTQQGEVTDIPIYCLDEL